MKRERRDQLITDLESDEYKKGKGNLRVGLGEHLSGDDEFCCLGVLCEEAVAAGVIEPPVRSEHTFTSSGDRPALYGGERSYPPPAVLEWAGLTVQQARDLADINDQSNSFETVVLSLYLMAVED